MPHPRFTVLITGASSGIGYELAKLFARDGHRLILVSRRREALERLAGELTPQGGGEVAIVPADLSRQDGPRTVEQQVAAMGLAVDVLVNNAGLGLYGLFHEAEIEPLLAMLQLNVLALTEMTWRFLGPMRKRGAGHILNVASTAAFQPGPYMAAYFASKAYVLHISEAIADELDGSGVKVTALCPGPTATSFAEAGGAAQAKMFRAPGLPTAAAVAAAGYQAMWRGDRVYVHGLGNKILAATVGLFPRKLVTRIVRTTKSSPA